MNYFVITEQKKIKLIYNINKLVNFWNREILANFSKKSILPIQNIKKYLIMMK